MFTKLSPKTLVALLFVAMPLIAGDKRAVVTLKGTTVADIICSDRNDHIGFNIPLAPAFIEWPSTLQFILTGPPKTLLRYPALYKTQSGILTTTAMRRFIFKSHTLFTDKEEQASYKKCITHCIEAHEAWYKKQDPKTLETLHAAEDIVFLQLKRLNLSNKETCTKLENILSTPLKNRLTKIANWITKPLCLYALENKHNAESPSAPMIQRKDQILLVQLLKLFSPEIIGLCMIFARDHFNRSSDLEFATTLTLCMLYSLFILAAEIMSSKPGETLEPDGGIKVIVELTHPEPEDKR